MSHNHHESFITGVIELYRKSNIQYKQTVTALQLIKGDCMYNKLICTESFSSRPIVSPLPTNTRSPPK